MGNPLKKTMVFLGLAEEELDEQGMPVESARTEQEPAAAAPAPEPASARLAARRAEPFSPARRVPDRLGGGGGGGSVVVNGLTVFIDGAAGSGGYCGGGGGGWHNGNVSRGKGTE